MSQNGSATHGDNIIDGSQKGASKGKGHSPRPAPDVKVTPKDGISLTSMFKPLTYQEADAKIREGADSFSFSAGNGKLGRVDVVSLATKFHREDFWNVSVVKGRDGHESLYVGLFDGHKYV